MNRDPVLVVGATGHVGSQVVRELARTERPVRALVRRRGATVAAAPPSVSYVQGDLADRRSLARALDGVAAVVSTANAIVPRRAHDRAATVNALGADALVDACEAAGVRRFVQSSVPTHRLDPLVPELRGKRRIERRLSDASFEAVVVRNPAFTDVWLVMTGVAGAVGPDPHATVRRPYGFMRSYLRLVSGLAERRGLLLAPGGPDHGAPFITTRDVALALAACVDHPGLGGRTLELGGPEWLTWRDVADRVARRLGRPVRPVTFPAWLASLGRAALRSFAPSASNVLALTQLVATYQPRWEDSPWVGRLGLPPQRTVDDYLDACLAHGSQAAFRPASG